MFNYFSLPDDVLLVLSYAGRLYNADILYDFSKGRMGWRPGWSPLGSARAASDMRRLVS
jgi:hypothetical protein